MTAEELNSQALQGDLSGSLLLPQSHPLSALELVKEPLYLLPKKEAEERALAMLERVGIQGDAVHKRPNLLVEANVSVLEFAPAVVSNLQFIVCDEPTSASGCFDSGNHIGFA